MIHVLHQYSSVSHDHSFNNCFSLSYYYFSLCNNVKYTVKKWYQFYIEIIVIIYCNITDKKCKSLKHENIK